MGNGVEVVVRPVIPGTYSVVEWLAFALLRIAMSLTLFTGLSLLAPAFSALGFGVKDPRIATGVGAALKFATVFLLAGLVGRHLTRSSRVILPNEREARGERLALRGWLLVLAVGLLVTPAVMFHELAPLRQLWREMLEILRAHHIVEQAFASPQMSGLILMPVVAALAVPFLQASAAVGFGFGSAVTLPLLAVRSFRFPRAYMICLLLQTALVISSLYGAELAAQLTAWALATVRKSGEGLYTPEAQQIVNALRHFDSVMRDTGDALVWTLAAYAFWVPPLLTSSRVRDTFAVVAQPSVAQPLVAQPAPLVAGMSTAGATPYAGYAGGTSHAGAASHAVAPPTFAGHAAGGVVHPATMAGEERRKFYEEAARALQSQTGTQVPQQTMFTAAFASLLVTALFLLLVAMQFFRHAPWWREGG